MNILVATGVGKELTKLFKSEKVISIFLEKLKHINPELIYLKRPYVKIKVSLFSTTFRIIGKFDKQHDILVIIFVLKKTDKYFGENIMWNKILENKLNVQIENISDDIEKGNFKLY